MKQSLLITAKEKLVARSAKPWACFETTGIDSEGLGIAMSWNKTFIEKLHAQGIQGSTDHETMQLFFLFMSSRIAEGLSDGDETINPAATPNLTNEANTLIK